MVTWEPWSAGEGVSQPKYALREIANGRHDAYVRRWARQAAAYDKPMYLRFAHEMNGSWYPWAVGVNGNTKAHYIAAWKYLRRVFAEEGADNVRWVWSPNADTRAKAVTLEELRGIYPGDEHVEWVALDGYNWGTTRDWSRWKSLGQTFGTSYDALVALTDKPVMIAETASAEAGGNKGEWVRRGLLEEVPSRLPRVRAIVWFHIDKEANWQVDSSPGSLEAYKEAATSRLYSGKLPLD